VNTSTDQGINLTQPEKRLGLSAGGILYFLEFRPNGHGEFRCSVANGCSAATNSLVLQYFTFTYPAIVVNLLSPQATIVQTNKP
jgi:hypothetical protein